MLVQALFLAASAAVASAQITYNGSNIICPASNPNGTFCAGNSLSTNIIIRCVNGVAQPGNCNDNLDGEPPVGLSSTTCWQTSLTSGDAACSKNCIVYCGSGGCAKDFTLPNCTPSFTASTSTASSTSYPTSPTSYPTTPTTSSTTTSTGTTVVTTGSTTKTLTFTTTYCPSSTITSGGSTGTGVPPPPPSNGTTTGGSGGNGGGSGNPTKTPTGPSSSQSAPGSGFTGAASAMSPMGVVAGAGLVLAYFL